MEFKGNRVVTRHYLKEFTTPEWQYNAHLSLNSFGRYITTEHIGTPKTYVPELALPCTSPVDIHELSNALDDMISDGADWLQIDYNPTYGQYRLCAFRTTEQIIPSDDIRKKQIQDEIDRYNRELAAHDERMRSMHAAKQTLLNELEGFNK